MATPKRRFFSKWDVALLAALLVFAGGWLAAQRLLAAPAGAVRADVYYNSRLVKSVALTPGLSEKFAVPGQPDVVLEVANGKIRFYSSTCRDKICIRSGFLSRPGESAACLPRKVAVKLVGTAKSKADQPDVYIS